MEWEHLAVLRAGRVDQVKVLENTIFQYFFEVTPCPRKTFLA
jgi:hypothetical protein